ncbi:Histone-lysine N-methyltransferase SETMAR [Habropoda laboriosa]|uniref:Histone-lysine N-methyltransferase SETMAR n=1 Tax=Habropoda laboriosa TaxID=597456 RepID=A0A0L7RCS4_9HYME|nr:Histone-lysine N-methyltransferase SETMAR [Habropoda laboriosa]
MQKKLFVKQASLVNRKGPILLHDNARPYVSQYETHTLLIPPITYLPTDYHFFKHFDNFLREHAANTFVEFINSRTLDFYCNGIETVAKRWKMCVESNGNYFD